MPRPRSRHTTGFDRGRHHTPSFDKLRMKFDKFRMRFDKLVLRQAQDEEDKAERATLPRPLAASPENKP